MSSDSVNGGRVGRVYSFAPHTRGPEPANPLDPPHPDDTERRTYTVHEAAKILGIGRNTAYECCKAGEIPTIKLGNRILVPKAALDALLEAAG